MVDIRNWNGQRWVYMDGRPYRRIDDATPEIFTDEGVRACQAISARSPFNADKWRDVSRPGDVYRVLVPK